MNELVELAMPWWEFVIRGALAYLILFLFLRMMGKRAFGEMSPFDIGVLILIGGTFRSGIVGKDTSLLGPCIAIGAIVALDRLLAWLACRSSTLSRIFEGSPLPLARHGKLLKGSLMHASISPAAFESEMRLREVKAISEIEMATLEPNGRISMLRKGKPYAGSKE